VGGIERGGGYSRKTKVSEALLELLDKLGAHLVDLVVGLKVVALLGGGVAADGRDVDHAVAVLDEGAALDGDVEVGDVVQDEAHELLVLVLANPLDEAVGGELLAELVGRQAVLGEAEVEEGGDDRVGVAELLLLLGQVAAADEADGTLLAQTCEQVEDLWGDGLSMGGSTVSFGELGVRGVVIVGLLQLQLQLQATANRRHWLAG